MEKNVSAELVVADSNYMVAAGISKVCYKKFSLNSCRHSPLPIKQTNKLIRNEFEKFVLIFRPIPRTRKYL